MGIFILLALVISRPDRQRRPRPIVISVSDVTAEERGDDAGAAATATIEAAAAPVPGPLDPPPLIEPPPVAVATVPTAPVVTDSDRTDSLVPISPDLIAAVAPAPSVQARPASLSVPTRPAAQGVGPVGDDPFASRKGRGRGQAAQDRGGSAASEAAVERALAWLARHQAVDGSWRFDLSDCRCDGGCRDAGTVTSTTASTGLVLLAFLGAGHTQADGEYREPVTRGIYYVLSRVQATPRGGDLSEGTMYGHGIATLALAEAFGMTRDDMLVPPLRSAVRFLETSQDLHGGGWRYLPGQPGDMTVTAWQLAALKSAALAGLEVPSPTIDGVSRFLDSVQARGGAAYGYRSPQAKPCTSAIGLLCRLYLGWEHEAVLDRGLTALAQPGPDPNAVYQNFYLSQGLLQRNHRLWPRWNARNRDQLIAQQARIGHELGSWFFAEPDTAPGGRLAHTALATLTLEVYYRLLPVYTRDAVDRGF
ncbi:MAG: prenyltransferase/squalene oxidase repeat-containing protein [Actinomycetota bacterium]